MVIDSNLFIEFFRAKDKATSTLMLLPKNQPAFVSSITVFELFIGARTPEATAQIEILLAEVTILPLDEPIAKLAGRLYDDLRRSSQTLDFRDVMIAATAIFHKMPIKTLNIRHFSRIPELVLA
jgi:tRNA(fMet)-specific endonuclease VapC